MAWWMRESALCRWMARQEPSESGESETVTNGQVVGVCVGVMMFVGMVGLLEGCAL